MATRPPGGRVLIVNPWTTDFAAYDFWMKPLGLLEIARLLRKTEIIIDLVDCMSREHPSLKDVCRTRSDGTGKFLKTPLKKPEVLSFAPRKYGRYGISAEAFEAELDRAGRPDAALITSHMTYWYEGVAEAAGRIARKWPGVPVVLGGRYATLCEEHARRTVEADLVLPGPFGRAAAEEIRDATGLPLNIDDEEAENFTPDHSAARAGGVAAMTLTRGCPFKCSYCASGVLNPGFRKKPLKKAVEELRFLVEERGVGHIAFYDDALLVDADRLLAPLLKEALKFSRRVVFHTPNALHSAMVTPEIARLMRAAGFSGVRLGLESVDPAFQEATGGKVSAGEFERAVENLFSAGFRGDEVGAYVICGHPAQTAGTIMAALRAAFEAGVEPIPTEYSPVPGSADFDAAVRAFRRPPDRDPLLQNSSIVMYQHPAITEEEFIAIKAESKAMRMKIREKRKNFRLHSCSK